MLLVIDVLPAARGVLAYNLEHSAGGSINCDLTPRGRDAQRLNSREIVAANLAPVGKDIAKMILSSEAPDPGVLKSFNARHQVKLVSCFSWDVATNVPLLEGALTCELFARIAFLCELCVNVFPKFLFANLAKDRKARKADRLSSCLNCISVEQMLCGFASEVTACFGSRRVSSPLSGRGITVTLESNQRACY